MAQSYTKFRPKSAKFKHKSVSSQPRSANPKHNAAKTDLMIKIDIRHWDRCGECDLYRDHWL